MLDTKEKNDLLIKKLKGFYIEDKKVKRIIINEKYNNNVKEKNKTRLVTSFRAYKVDFNTKGLLGKNEDYLIVQQLGEK